MICPGVRNKLPAHLYRPGRMLADGLSYQPALVCRADGLRLVRWTQPRSGADRAGRDAYAASTDAYLPRTLCRESAVISMLKRAEARAPTGWRTDGLSYQPTLACQADGLRLVRWTQPRSGAICKRTV